jgi:hypothetical protein
MRLKQNDWLETQSAFVFRGHNTLFFQFLRMGFGSIRIDRHYRLVTQYTAGLVNLCGIKTTKTGIALGS